MTKFSRFDDAMPCWVDVMVETSEEQEALRVFLSTVFDWTWDTGSLEMGSYSFALSQGLPVLGLGKADGAHGVTTTYFTALQIDEAMNRAMDDGATSVVGKMQVGDQGAMAILEDPLGVRFGLWQPNVFQGFGVMHEPNSPGWFDEGSSDPERASEFYAKWSGHELTSVPGGDMRVLANGEQWYASFSEMGDQPAQWTPIYVVDSLERVREVVTRHGGAILVEEMPVPGSAICVFSEPVNGTAMTVMRAGEAPQ